MGPSELRDVDWFQRRISRLRFGTRELERSPLCHLKIYYENVLLYFNRTELQRNSRGLLEPRNVLL